MNPSLLLIPDRYKASKLYSQIPDSGAGDLAFTRANDTATRVNSQGLIEKVRTNLALQSEAFDTTWLTYGGTNITANAVAAPNGTLTADRIDGTSASFRGVYQTISSSATPHTFSVYLKSATGSSTTCRIWVDSVASLVTVTNDWQRFVVTGTTAASFDIQITAAVASAIDVYAWGAQLETGDIATPYIPTTTAAVSVGPVADIPRIDYTGGGCGKLLLEPQRINLATFSEQANSYTKIGATIGSNVLVSPDGFTNADSIIEDASTGSHAFFNFTLTTFTVAPNTASVFAKKASRDWFALQLFHSSSQIAFFNLDTGTIGTVTAGATATITNFGNGWYRCTITATTTANTGGIAIYSANADNSISFTGTNGLTAAYFYGWQLEAGSYATSYIPTLGASVTRSADAASKTGISSLIGVNGGSIFIEFDANGLGAGIDSSYIFDLSDGTNFNSNRIAMYWGITSNDLRFFYGYGGTFSESIYNFNFLTTKKIGVRWTSTQIQVVVNGVAQTALTYGNSSPTKLNIASRFNDVERLGSNIKVCALYNNTLSTAELQTLTTL